MKTSDKVLAILRLFSTQSPEWSVEDAARALGIPQSTAYDHFRSLADAGLIVSSKAGRYVIGPAVIEFDRLSRMTDPLIAAAQPELRQLALAANRPCVALLCRIYRMKVMSVDEVTGAGASFAISYKRGQPMPLARGAASKVILAHLDRRKLRRFFNDRSDELAAAGLGDSWEVFRLTMRRIRSQPAMVTRGEVDPGRVGISAPVFLDGEVIASFSLVVEDDGLDAEIERQLALDVASAATRISIALDERQKPT